MRWSKPSIVLGFGVVQAFLLVGMIPAEPREPGAKLANPPGAEVFAGTNVPAFRIDIDASSMDGLRQQPRQWAKATLRAENVVYKDVAVHVKGSQGSLQSIDARPSLTVSFTKLNHGRKFHGLGKIHFNNEAEDPSFMTEILCSEMCRQAGLPAARSGYATLTLNGRSLGLYVLKEGLTKEFLGQYFSKTGGNFYDGGFRKDINEPLERIGGDGPDDQTDRRALYAAARESDPQRRWQRLNEVLDMDRFISLLAMSTITWNWDGYPMARNNYRIYHDPATDKLVFIPHGLDQMFWEPQGTIYPPLHGIVAVAVIGIPEARSRYRDRLASLQTNVFLVTPLQRRIDELAAQIRPFRSEAAQQGPRLKQKIAARWQSIDQQLRITAETKVEFVHDITSLRGWAKLPGSSTAELEETQTPEKVPVLRIAHSQPATSSWALRVWLQRGTYELTGRCQTKRLARSARPGPSPVALRSSAPLITAGSRPTALRSGDWEPLQCAFEVRGRQEMIDLSCSFRNAEGEVWFDLNSLQLRRVRMGAAPN